MPDKRARFCANPPSPEAENPSANDDFDMFLGEDADAEVEPRSHGLANDHSECETSSPSATRYEGLEDDNDQHDPSNHNPESSPNTSVAQHPVTDEYLSMRCQDSASAEKASTLIKDRAVGTLLTDWPAKAGGLTENICDLKTLKQFMVSDKLNGDHKAMWISLVQTIVHEPDQNSVLAFLQNTLSGNSTLPVDSRDHLREQRQSQISRNAWAVTNAIETYGKGKKRWSAAHFVDLALWLGGPAAGIQAARALKVFGVWNPSGNFDLACSVHSIRRCLDREVILHKIWPDEIDGEELLVWANYSQGRTEHPFMEFKDAHSHLLHKCVGEDLGLFPRLARNFAQVGDASNRIISRAYFDSTLAPILLQHFDKNVDIELAYSAVVDCQGKSVDRLPAPKHAMQIRMLQARPSSMNLSSWKHGAGGYLQPLLNPPIFHPSKGGGANEDDEEPDYPQAEKSIKPDPDITENITPGYQTPGYQEVVRTRNNWTDEETDACISTIVQVVAERAENGTLARGTWPQIMERLVSEHKIQRTTPAVRNRWYDHWSLLPENKETVQLLKSRYTSNNVSRIDRDGEEESSQNDNDSESRSRASADSSVVRLQLDSSEDGAEEHATDVHGSDQAPSHELQPPPRGQARIGHHLQNRTTTRSMSSSDSMIKDKQITNKFYQQSRDVPSEVIARFLERGNPSLRRHWNEVSEHRLSNDMTTLGPQHAPPFPLVGLLDHPQVPQDSRHPHRGIGDIALEQQEKDVEDDIRKFKRFAESFLG